MGRVVQVLAFLLAALWPQAAGAEPPRVNPPERSLTCSDAGAHTTRLYRTMFGRPADRPGLLYWLGQRYDGLTGDDVAFWMSAGAEFERIYGGLDDPAYVGTIYRNLLGREAEPEGLRYWTSLAAVHGRANVASWMTQTPEFALVWPVVLSSSCAKAFQFGLTEVRPGLHVGQLGTTVTVLAQRDLVDYRAVSRQPTTAQAVAGDIVVNANWFTAAGPIGPVVSDGRASGSRDLRERGQIVGWRLECTGGGEMVLEHVWTWRDWTPDPCVATAVSGVSLVHKGVRADAYPGIDITRGPTNTDRAHSFIGFNDTEIVVIATREMTASMLADYAIRLGVDEGVMLDGGNSTQIRTPLVSFGSGRSVPAFAVLQSRAR